MGEAKRRKALDPHYGQTKRGLIVSCPLEIQGTQLLVKSTHLDPQELRCREAGRVRYVLGRAAESESPLANCRGRCEVTLAGCIHDTAMIAASWR